LTSRPAPPPQPLVPKTSGEARSDADVPRCAGCFWHGTIGSSSTTTTPQSAAPSLLSPAFPPRPSAVPLLVPFVSRRRAYHGVLPGNQRCGGGRGPRNVNLQPAPRQSAGFRRVFVRSRNIDCFKKSSTKKGAMPAEKIIQLSQHQCFSTHGPGPHPHPEPLHLHPQDIPPVSISGAMCVWQSAMEMPSARRRRKFAMGAAKSCWRRRGLAKSPSVSIYPPAGLGVPRFRRGDSQPGPRCSRVGYCAAGLVLPHSSVLSCVQQRGIV